MSIDNPKNCSINSASRSKSNRKQKGYFQLASLRGVPIFVHWSFPAGGILISIISHTPPEQWLYYCLAYTLLVAIHESGHVLAAITLKIRLFSVEISGLGGLCRFERPRQVLHSLILYSAGLIAQAITFIAALAYIRSYGEPKSVFGMAILMTFTFVNAVMFAINLIPQNNSRTGLSSDGLVLLKLLLHVALGRPHPHPPLIVLPTEQAPVFPPETRLISKPGFQPDGFSHGIEILNDTTTPMDFVVSTLITHLKMTKNEAVTKMLEIHNTGGVLIAVENANEAHNIADAISEKARASGYSFVCRYASVQPRTGG